MRDSVKYAARTDLPNPAVPEIRIVLLESPGVSNQALKMGWSNIHEGGLDLWSSNKSSLARCKDAPKAVINKT